MSFQKCMDFLLLWNIYFFTINIEISYFVLHRIKKRKEMFVFWVNYPLKKVFLKVLGLTDFQKHLTKATN